MSFYGYGTIGDDGSIDREPVAEIEGDFEEEVALSDDDRLMAHMDDVMSQRDKPLTYKVIRDESGTGWMVVNQITNEKVSPDGNKWWPNKRRALEAKEKLEDNA